MDIPSTKNNPAAIADMHGQKDFIEEMNPKFFVGNHKNKPSISAIIEETKRHPSGEPVIKVGLSGINETVGASNINQMVGRTRPVMDMDVAHAYLTPIFSYKKKAV